MHFSWYLLDKKSATIQAVRIYDHMKFIVDHNDEEVAEAIAKKDGLGAASMDGTPRGQNERATEDRIISAIDKIDSLQECRRLAEEYMAWFKPAWDHLTEDERFVLGAFYLTKEEYPVDMVMSKFHIERTSAYKKKDRALSSLQLLLYGIV